MKSEISYAPRINEKRELFSMKLDPVLKSEAMLLAEQEGQTLSSFIEDAIRIAVKAKLKDDIEPNPGHSPPSQRSLSRKG